MNLRKVVRERIDPRLTASLFANYRSAIDALLELVDNAVDSRVAERTLRVDLIVRPESIVLTAIGGMGMGPPSSNGTTCGGAPRASGQAMRGR